VVFNRLAVHLKTCRHKTSALGLREICYHSKRHLGTKTYDDCRIRILSIGVENRTAGFQWFAYAQINFGNGLGKVLTEVG
jgi:hypothetical protein